MLEAGKWASGCAIVLSLSLIAGCATPVGIRHVNPAAAERSMTANVLTSDRPSAEAMQFLTRLALVERAKKEPEAVLRFLHDGLGGHDESDRLFALAELSFKEGVRHNHRSYFLSAAAYAYAYLFPDDVADVPGPYDPRLRLAMDIYNRAVARGLIDEKTKLTNVQAQRVPVSMGSLSIDIDPSGFELGGYQLVNLASVADVEVRGLRNRYRHPGIGAAMIAKAKESGDAAHDKWLPRNSRVPVTLLLRFDDVRRSLDSGDLHATLELYDIDAAQEVSIGAYTVPIEFDTSAALAYRLEGAPVWDFEIAGFRRGDLLSAAGVRARLGLSMIHPYQAGRIPVVFVHGTASSPARWAEIANELLGDSRLRDRYQLWFFMYATGNPIAYSAMRLREDLQAVVRDVDPQGKDPALQRMVVIGHSQGGLLTKMTAVSSGTKFLSTVTDKSIDEIDVSEDTRDLLRRSAFVEPLPYVRRLVFIATPHKGSFLTANFFGNIARKLVSLPGNLMRASVELAKLNPIAAVNTTLTLPTSIDNMNWNSPFLRTLHSLPIAPAVSAHSIIAVLPGDEPIEEGNDGVVEYTSAHIEGVDSELIVRSGHSTQDHPNTIEEVRRILYEHAGLTQPPAPATAVEKAPPVTQ